ncbi:brain mitochondrial carrier protein 1 isoform X1 [Tympanuchus pallidicinctus]|uniref:brain mitochondrial carrier protein 1 isoform X1 n=1 Tax=Tympanuchus pallidicinctus TaxID=109042 RepID=UPI0022872580|nr:brain mitochondrial carrier protein 1 isoform X1 [Tympanuchus pallidicinctus]
MEKQRERSDDFEPHLVATGALASLSSFLRRLPSGFRGDFSPSRSCSPRPSPRLPFSAGGADGTRAPGASCWRLAARGRHPPAVRRGALPVPGASGSGAGRGEAVSGPARRRAPPCHVRAELETLRVRRARLHRGRVRHVPRGPDQDAPAGAGPERRCAVPRGALPRHVPRPVPHLPRGGRPRPLFGDRPCAAETGVLRHHQDRHLPEPQAAVRGAPGRPGAARGLVSSGKCCDETLLINVICGVVSGVISSALANPTDVLKIRMQAQGSLFQGGMIGSFIDIYQQEGTRGLWRGVVPTAQRAAIVVGVELPVYDITKKHLILSGLMGDTIFTHFVSSFTCGLAGAIASNPVDVVRTRMMNQRAIVGSVELYKGTLDGLVKTWKSEGFFALYKGFWPNWLRLGPWNIIFFITYEQLKRLPF